MADLPNINTEMLRWARDTARLSLEEAAARMRLPKGKYQTPEQRLEAFEQGKARITANQLQQAADAFRRPLLVFYMKTPPKVDPVLPDFRTIADHGIREPSVELATLIRRLRARQSQVAEILREEDAPPNRFVGSLKSHTTPNLAASTIRAALKITVADQLQVPNKEAFFKLLRQRIEELGLYVQFAGDLGSHHTQIAPEEFRGLALVDSHAPFIAINPYDAAAAHIFTLLHELIHLWLGESAITNLSPFGKARGANHDEVFCNQVTAEFLLPEREFLESWQSAGDAASIIKILGLSRKWKVSRAVVARRLFELRQIPEDAYWAMLGAFQADWRQHKQKLQEAGGGPSYHLLASRKLGGALIKTVLNAMDSGAVTYSKASQILNVRTKGFDELRRLAF